MSDPAPGHPYWNHRVVRRTCTPEEHALSEQPYEYAIHEAYYHLPDDSDRPTITVDAVAVHADTLDGLRETLHRMLRALERPVLDYDTCEPVEPAPPRPQGG